MLYLFDNINKFFLKRKVIKAVEKEGFNVTDFEFLPPDDRTPGNRMTIVPLNDSFNHTDESCPCRPEVKEVESEGVSTTIITHYDYFEVKTAKDE